MEKYLEEFEVNNRELVIKGAKFVLYGLTCDDAFSIGTGIERTEFAGPVR